MIVEVINHKSVKYVAYDTRLGHINLIIYDMENRYQTLQREDFYQYFYNYNLFSTIKNSPFREIYLITKFRDNKQFYFPLKLILLMSEVYLLNGFLVENKEYSAPFNDLKDEKIIYSFFLSQGINAVSLIEDENNTELLYGNYGILIDDKGNKITLHDYAENPLPTQNIIDEMLIKKIDSKIIDEYSEFKKHYTFENSIGFEVN